MPVPSHAANESPRSGEEAQTHDSLAASPGRYALSFTTGALLSREAALLAPVYLEEREWEAVRNQAVAGNLLQARTHSTGVRLVREAVNRLSVLSDGEVELLVEGTASERRYLMWAAACRRYEFIGEFAEGVLRERFLLRASTLGHENFDSFVRTKALWHEELAQIKDSTLHKLRSNVFRMLQEAELVSQAGDITPAVLSERVVSAMRASGPNELRFFPTHQPAGHGVSA